ncbi:MAG: tRNA uracil 4-sulfurtransferase ThiI [Patescibacteria group bacterium]
MKYNCIICHYDEIGTKGQNRINFERQLIDNIHRQLAKNLSSSNFKVKRVYGRIIIEITEFFDTEIEQAKKILTRVFGLANISLAVCVKQNIEVIIQTALELVASEKYENFRVTTCRSDKNFPLTSLEVNIKVGEAIYETLHKAVKLKDSELTCYIELVDKKAYLYTEKIAGAGGLPVGSSGRAVCLLSGGIDSPVSAYYAAKRGLSLSCVHFHSYPHTGKESIYKVKELASIINSYCPDMELYLCPFINAQKKIFAISPDKLRIILYRRFMMRVAEKISALVSAEVLVTGEALGQVASQTVSNMSVVQEAVNLLILRPLIGFDKKEIISKAQAIGTYETSIQPHDDCCVVFMPKHPETKAKMHEIQAIEKDLDIDGIVNDCVAQCEIIRVKY